MSKQWFHFEVADGAPLGYGRYLGKCQATIAEVRRAFPQAEINESGLVRIYGLSKESVRDAERSKATGKNCGVFATTEEESAHAL